MGDVVKRIGKKGRAKFYLRYMENGKRKQTAARGCKNEKEAQDALTQIEHNILSGRAGLKKVEPIDLAKQAVTVARLIERFSTEYTRPKLKSAKKYREHAKHVLSHVGKLIGRRPASSMTKLDIEELRDVLLAEKRSPTTVRNELTFLRTAYGWALRKEIIDGKNPISGVELPKANESIDYLSKLEAGKLLEHAEQRDPALHAMIVVALLQGLRKGEIVGLRRTDINFGTNTLVVAKSYDGSTKSGKIRLLPLHPTVARVLRQWLKVAPQHDGLVFPITDRRGTRGKPGKRYRMGRHDDMLGLPEAMEAAGCHLPEAPWHSLRHTFGSHYIMSGGDIVYLMELMGHANVKTTMVYVTTAKEHAAVALGRLSFALPDAAVGDLDEARRQRAVEPDEDCKELDTKPNTTTAGTKAGNA